MSYSDQFYMGRGFYWIDGLSIYNSDIGYPIRYYGLALINDFFQNTKGQNFVKFHVLMGGAIKKREFYYQVWGDDFKKIKFIEKTGGQDE
jgi:hypothetical protein